MYHLAIDIGASSGRHILGWLEDGKIRTREIYRFENGVREQGGHLTWDVESLTAEVVAGIAACKKIGMIPKTIAIDTWGVDYVLLDENEKEILPVIAYRDRRVQGVPEEVDQILPRGELFARCGIQPLDFNTIYQLICDKKSGRLDGARYFLMIPAYLSWRLTGVKKNEYTNATTTSLVHARNKTWDGELLDRLGIDKKLFGELSLPGEKVGDLKKEISEQVGFQAEVIFCPSHDTASAVAACPMEEGSVFVSSGTWSLIGTELSQPILQNEAMLGGFTNEGGIEYRYRFLENIMGMWLFQNIRKNLNKKYSYDEMMQMAMESDYTETFDPNAPSLVAPENMIDAIRSLLGDEALPLGDLLSSVYHSLAASYNRAVKTVEA
ncbi:MAG: rhamnulokinase, partial [Clostridia bacterium]|nr:rhamnulokinase [Clostridia bacterium]